MDHDDVGSSDAALLAKARRGERAAFGAIYDRHVRPVYWQAYAVLGDAVAAEDATQEVFITAWQKVRTITVVDSSVLPWLLVTARYMALNARRSAVRHQRRNSELDEGVAAATSVEDDVTASLVRAEIDKAVAELSDLDRRLYTLCIDDDHTYEQAAATLGISHASVRNRLSRLRHRLRADLRSIRETA